MTSQSRGFPPEVKSFPVDHSFVDAHRLEGEVCDVVFARYPAGMSLATHQHDDVNIVGVVTEGLVHLTVAGEERAYGPGDWFHVPATVEHAAFYERTTCEIELFFPVFVPPV